jgi:hypothetical protein
MVNIGGNGNGNGYGNSQRISWGNVLSIISLGAGLAWTWQNLATGQARIEEQIKEEQGWIQIFQRDHDSLTKLEGQVDELWQAKFPHQGQ